MKALPTIAVCLSCFLSTFFPGTLQASETHVDDVYWESILDVRGVHGSVSSLTEYRGMLIVGGLFDAAHSTIAENVAAWDGSSWIPLGEGPYNTQALTVYDNKIIVGTTHAVFSTEFDSSVVDPADLTWSTVGSSLGGAIKALTSYNDRLIAGGKFTASGGTSFNRIAGWDGASWSPLGSGMNDEVLALTVYDNKLIAGGSFTAAGGTSANYIASWDGSTWSPLGTGTNSYVRSLTVHGGRLIAGGSFGSAGGVPASNIAAWDGVSWSPLAAGVPERITALTVHDGKLIAGGLFYRSMKAWDGVSWAPLGTECYNAPEALLSYNGKLIAASKCIDNAGFDTGTPQAWDGNSWSSLGTGWTGRVSDFAVYDDKLIVAGTFRGIGDVATRNIAAWDGVNWYSLGAENINYAAHLAVYDDRLIAAGHFSFFDGQATAKNIAAWDGSSWKALGPGIDYDADALQVYNGKLYASYNYNAAPDNHVYGIVTEWDGSSWDDVGFFAPFSMYPYSCFVDALTVYENKLVVAGVFSQPAENMAAYDGSSFEAYGPWHQYYVSDLAVYNNELVATLNSGIGVWNGSESRLISGCPCSFLFVYDGKLLVFEGDSYCFGNHINTWDGSVWSTLGSGVNGLVTAAAVYEGKLTVAGLFGVAGGKATAGFARWTKFNETTVLITGFRARETEDGIALSWSVHSDESFEGFHIYRRGEGDATEKSLNDKLIPASETTYLDRTVLPGERYVYTLAAVGARSGEVRSLPAEAELPLLALELYQNSPNPFNPTTTIRYAVPRASRVTLRVYTSAGQLVRTLVDGKSPAGAKEVTWDGTNDDGGPVASGVYVYRLQTGKETRSKKMVLLK